MVCDKCGKELPDNADFCVECGAQVTKPVENVNETPDLGVAPVDGKKKSGLIVALVAAAAVVILLIVLLVSVIGGKDSATDSVHSVQQTALSGANYELNIKYDDEKIKITGFYNIDAKKQTAEFYAKSNVDDLKTEVAVSIDGDKVYVYQSNSSSEEGNVETFDMDDVDLDSDLVFDILSDLSKKDIEDIDFEKYLDEFDLADEIEDYIEPKDVGDALGAVLKALDKNAEDCLGVEKDGKTYSYDIDVYDTIVVAVEAIEKYVVDEDDYEDLVEFIDDNKDELKDIENIEFEMTYDGKYISEYSMDSDGISFSIAFENVGKCKDTLDKDILEAISDAK